jgi:hypothetical protein
MNDALLELDRFIADAQPASMFVHVIEDLVHNVGVNCAWMSLARAPQAGDLLSRLLADGRAELIQRSFPEEKAARIRLLCGMNAFNHGELQRARQYVNEFLEKQTSDEGDSSERRGWRRLANVMADCLAIEQDKTKGIARSSTRWHDDSGVGRFLRLAQEVRDRLTHCEVGLLPLHAALAIVHSELTGTPGARCVPVCHQLQGGLEHLGFGSEVIAASAMLGDKENITKYIREYLCAPSLRDDGSTNGHAVLWAASFRQLVDPTIVQARQLQAIAEDNPDLSYPVVLPVADRDMLFAGIPIATFSRALVKIAWFFRPQWIPMLSPVDGSDLDVGLSYGKLALAYAALEVIRSLELVRSDFGRLRDLYPSIAGLLDGSNQLPRLPTDPPPAFARCGLR